MFQDHHILLVKSAIAFAAAGGLYVADVFTSAPTWVSEFGLPIAMLMLAIVGMVAAVKALMEERKSRIADRDAFIAQLIHDRDAQTTRQVEEAKRATEAHLTLIHATQEQTREFKSLCEELRKK